MISELSFEDEEQKKEVVQSGPSFFIISKPVNYVCVFSQYPNYHTLFSYWIWEKTNRKFLSGKTLLSVSRFFCIIYSTGFWMEDLVNSEWLRNSKNVKNSRYAYPQGS